MIPILSSFSCSRNDCTLRQADDSIVFSIGVDLTTTTGLLYLDGDLDEAVDSANSDKIASSGTGHFTAATLLQLKAETGDAVPPESCVC